MYLLHTTIIQHELTIILSYVTLLFEFSMSDIPLNPWELILANTNSFFQVCNFVFIILFIFYYILLSAWYKKVPRNVLTYIGRFNSYKTPAKKFLV